MTLSPSLLVCTMLMACHAVGKDTLEAAADDVQRATLLVSRGDDMLCQLQTGYTKFLRNLRLNQHRDFFRISHSIWIPGHLPFENTVRSFVHADLSICC